MAIPSLDMETTTPLIQQQGNILNPPPQCFGCIIKSQNPPSSPEYAPGHLYALRYCNHYMCRSCLTTQYTQYGSLQTYCACSSPTDLIVLPDIDPYLAPDYISNVHLLEIFNASSPLYAANTAISIDPTIALRVFTAVYTQALKTHPLSLGALSAEYLARQLRIYINSWRPRYLNSPELAVSELRVRLQDIFWTYMVRVPAAKVPHLKGMFGNNRDAEARGQYPLIMGMRRADPLLDSAYSVWDDCLDRWGAVLAAWWWDGFLFEHGWSVVCG